MTGTELLQNALRAADRRKENFTKDADEWRRETRRIFRLREKVSDLRRSIRSAEPPRLYGDTYDGRCGDVESALRAAAGLLDSMHDIARANAAFYSERAGI